MSKRLTLYCTAIYPEAEPSKDPVVGKQIVIRLADTPDPNREPAVEVFLKVPDYAALDGYEVGTTYDFEFPG